MDDVVIASEFSRAVCKHFGLPLAKTSCDMLIKTSYDEVFGIQINIMLSPDDLAAIANHMGGTLPEAPADGEDSPVVEFVSVNGIVNKYRAKPSRPAPPMPECKPPKAERTEVLTLAPGDTLALSCDRMLTNDAVEQIKASALSALPDGVKVMVLHGGLKVGAAVTLKPAACGKPYIPQPSTGR